MGKPTRPITLDEFSAMVDTGILTPDVYSALYTQLNTGLRIQDVSKMEYDKIKYGKLELIEKKTGKPQITRINIDVVEFLDKLRTLVNNKSKYVFLYREDYKPSSFVRKVQLQIQRACDYANIDSTFISTHSFRKAFATKAYEESGRNLILVQHLLNHSNVSITQRYINSYQKEIDKFRENQNRGTDIVYNQLKKLIK